MQNGVIDGLGIGLGACAVTILSGVPILGWLRRNGVRQNVSVDAPERHAAKQGTPTMGGLMVATGFVAGVLLWAALGGMTASGWILCCTVALFGLIGLLDDVLIIRRGRNLGLGSRSKLLLQFVAAIGVITAAYLRAPRPALETVLGVSMTWPFAPLAVIWIVGLSNATNLADGLDGLTPGMASIALFGTGVSVYASGGDHALGATTLALAGACAGFLWYNVHPAQVFLGNTGALALGAFLAAHGVLAGAIGTVLVATAMFWVETLSVIAQVLVFKHRRRRHGVEYARGHRLLRRAPLHHHFEEIGWPETRVVGRFWLITLLCSGSAIILASLGWT